LFDEAPDQPKHRLSTGDYFGILFVPGYGQSLPEGKYADYSANQTAHNIGFLGAFMDVGGIASAGGLYLAPEAAGPFGPIFGTRYAGNDPWLNASKELRIGWSYFRETGEYVFRIGGNWLKPFMNNPHIYLWPPRWWGGQPVP